MKQLEIITYGTATLETLTSEEKTALYQAIIERILSFRKNNEIKNTHDEIKNLLNHVAPM